MNHWISAFCATNGIRLHYTRTGGQKPAVLLLHGLMTNGLCWTDLARALEADYDVIMPDARGHGRSSRPDSGYGYEDHAADIAGLIRGLELAAPIVLGHSMGGMTAAVVASQNPALLRGLVLADPTFLSPEVQREVWASNVAEQHRRMLTLTLAEVIADGQRRHPHRSAELVEIFARARLQTSLNAFEVLRPPNPDFRQVVAAITVPTLLVCGEKGIVTAAVAQELQELNSRLQVAHIPQTGHTLHLDQPERFATVVQDFLGSLSPSGFPRP